MTARFANGLLAGLLMLLPISAQAQSTSRTPEPARTGVLNAGAPKPAAPPSALLAGPRGLPAVAPVPLRSLVATSSAPMVQGIRHRGPGVALMVVGGAGIVTGLIIDEGVVTVAGALAGLYGLYLYLR